MHAHMVLTHSLIRTTVVYFNKHTRFAVVRCAREQCKLVESSLAFVTECQSQEVRIRVARVCGTNAKYFNVYSDCLGMWEG